MSSYSNNIPQSDQDPTDSQPLLLDNFKAIFNAQNRNHVDFEDINNSGRHEVIELKDQASNPTPIIGFGDLFVRDDSGTQNLFFLDDTSKEFQLTNAFTDDTNGQATLPGGLQFQWGTKDNVLTLTPIPFNEEFNSPAFNVQISEERDNDSVRSLWISQGSITATEFKIRTTDTSGRIIKWFAIGLKMVT